MIVSLLSTNLYFKSKLADKKGSKIDDVMRFSPKHVFSSNNDPKYYISMNLKML